MDSIPIPPERESAWKRYERKFGKPFPAYYVYFTYGNDYEKEIADIDRRIRENDPAPDKKLPDNVLF